VDRYLRLLERLAIPQNRIGLNVFRVCAGCLILLQYLLNYPQRHFLFGPNGAYPFELSVSLAPVFSLYHLSSSPLVFEVLFHTGIVLTLGWVCGIKTRLLTPLTLLFWISLRQTNTMLWDGGDNLMQLVLIYAMFADLSPLRPGERDQRAPRSTWATITGLVHNAAVLAMALQVCVLYGVSALAKVQGDTWQNGTALYYALWPEQFRFPGVTEHLLRSAPLLSLLSHATVFFQVSFPFLYLLNRRTRHFAVLMAISFHLGIAGMMGLFTFAGFMITADLALIGDSGYLAVARLARSAWRRLSPKARPSFSIEQAAPSPQ
ncbi:MAG: hypothetical protein RL033_1814, partial [Pseudomonadota bacterium]